MLWGFISLHDDSMEKHLGPTRWHLYIRRETKARYLAMKPNRSGQKRCQATAKSGFVAPGDDEDGTTQKARKPGSTRVENGEVLLMDWCIIILFLWVNMIVLFFSPKIRRFQMVPLYRSENVQRQNSSPGPWHPGGRQRRVRISGSPKWQDIIEYL